MRSLILTPGDDPARLMAALASQAHAVVIDLDVAANRRETARETAAHAVDEETKRSDGPALIVRLSPLDFGRNGP